MLFTLDMLRLMRDYNGRILFLPRAFMPASEGLSYETDRIFLT